MSDKSVEIEARRAQRKADADAAFASRNEADLEAIDELEAASGVLTTLTTGRAVEGLPVRVAIRAPNSMEYKRFAQQIRRAKDKEEQAKAQDLLARSVLVYPADKELQDRMADAFPGLLMSIAVEAAKLVELQADAEGKG